MKNVTIAVDETTYARARVVAARRGTSVSRMVRDLLNQIEARGSASREWSTLWREMDAGKVCVGTKPSRARTYRDARIR